MGRKGKQPRNNKGQYASYPSTAPPGCSFAARQPSLLRKEVILVDSDSEDDNIQAKIDGKRVHLDKGDTSSKFPRHFAADVYNDDSGDTMEYSSEGSDDVEGLLDEVDEVFDEAKKMMCTDGVVDPAKVPDGLDYLYEGVLGASVELRSKRGKEAISKKLATKAPHK